MVIVKGPFVTLKAMTPVSNGQLWGQVFAVAEWKTPPPCESLLMNWKVLFTPITSRATSGEYAVVVRVALPKLIRIVMHCGGAHVGPEVEVAGGLVMHELGLQRTNW